MKNEQKAQAAGVFRIIQIANKKPYVAISASRHNFTNEENDKRNKEMLSDIKSLGLYAYEMLGGYEETKKDGSKVQVVEDSFFVPFDERRTLDAFINSFIELTAKYSQESFLLGLPAGYDYENFPTSYPSLKTGFHYFVNKDGHGTVAGTKATIKTFEDYGSIGRDPRKNRILEWKIVGLYDVLGAIQKVVAHRIK